MINTSALSPLFWRDKQVLLTGHSGFKGSWLALWLHRLGAKVHGISLEPVTSPNLFNLARVNDICQSHFCDIRDKVALKKIVKEFNPEIVFHLAAQSLVRRGYHDPLVTFETNVMGSANLLDVLREIDSLRAIVMVTTDKVYHDNKSNWPYREDDVLGGPDPYGASKAASEIVIASYRDSFFSSQDIAVATARAGNVIGGGDWSEDRLIPDLVKAWQTEQPLIIRNPQSIRPWQHVVEPLAGYLTLAEKLSKEPALAGAYNFGPDTSQVATVDEVVDLASNIYKFGAKRYQNTNKNLPEAIWLGLEITKAKIILGVTPKWNLAQTVSRTMSWYRKQEEGLDARKLCEEDIAGYEALL